MFSGSGYTRIVSARCREEQKSPRTIPPTVDPTPSTSDKLRIKNRGGKEELEEREWEFQSYPRSSETSLTFVPSIWR